MADLALVLLMAVWGSSFAILRFFLGGAGGDASRVASPLAFLAARMGVAVALLVPLLLARRSTRHDLAKAVAPGALAPKGLLRDGLACGLLLAVGFILQTEGYPRTTASRSGFFTGLIVAFVPLIELVTTGKRPPPPALTAIALALGGMALLAGPLGSGDATFNGDVLTIACAFVFAGHILVLNRVARRHPIAALVLLQLSVVGLSAALLGPWLEPTRLPRAPSVWAAIVYLAIFATLIAYFVQTWAQRRVTAVRIALLSSLEPVFAAAIAAVALGERLAMRERAGGALIVLGVVIGEAGAAWWNRRAPSAGAEMP